MGATTVQDDRAAVEQWLDALERWVLGHRHVVAPPLTAAAMWVSSGLAWALTGTPWVPLAGRVQLGWWPLIFYGLALVAVLGVFGVDIVHETERVPLVGPDRPGERGDEAKILNTKVGASFGWGFGVVWCGVQAWYGPSAQTTLVLALFLVPVWVVWFHSRRVRRGVEVFRYVQRWDGDAVGLPGLEAVESSAKADEDGTWFQWRLRSDPKGRWTAAAIRKAVGRIGARYERDPDEITIEEPRPGSFLLRWVRADPNEKPLTFEAPPEAYSIRQRARVGRWDDDGTPMLVSLYRDDHGGVDGLAIGLKGGGKSNYEEIVACYAAAGKDALLWLIDLKPGAQQWGPWAGVADWLATTPEEADRMFAALMVVMEVRGGAAGRIVKPTTKRPAIVVVLDEGALYYNPVVPSGGPEQMAMRRVLTTRISLQENLLATSRSFAIAVRVALQRAVWDNIGGATIRGHLVGGEAAIFRTSKNEDARLAVDMTADEAEVMRTSKIPTARPGTCFIRNADNEEPRRGRIFKFTEAERDDVVAKYRDRQPVLEQAVQDALGEVYANRQRTRTGGALSLAKDAPEPEPEDEPAGMDGPVAQRLSESDSLALAWRACAADELRGATLPEVADRTGRSPEWARIRVKHLERLAVVRRHGKRWLSLGTEQQLRDKLENDSN